MSIGTHRLLSLEKCCNDVDKYAVAEVTITGKTVNKRKSMGMEVSCTILFSDTKPILSKLKEVLQRVKFNKKYMVWTYFCLSLLNFHGII